jgi:hypothetical protein
VQEPCHERRHQKSEDRTDYEPRPKHGLLLLNVTDRIACRGRGFPRDLQREMRMSINQKPHRKDNHPRLLGLHGIEVRWDGSPPTEIAAYVVDCDGGGAS